MYGEQLIARFTTVHRRLSGGWQHLRNSMFKYETRL